MADDGTGPGYHSPVLTPASPAEIANATYETCRTYGMNASLYAEATLSYAAFPGIREEVTSFAATVRPGDPVLDLGAGAGRDSTLLAGIGYRVAAADICMPLLEGLHRSVGGIGVGSIGCICVDICDLPFSDAAFGGAWASGSLLHLPSSRLLQGLSEVFRVLKPNAMAAISMRAGSGEGWRADGSLEGRRWFTLVEPDKFIALMREVGFRSLKWRYVGRSGWFLASGQGI